MLVHIFKRLKIIAIISIGVIFLLGSSGGGSSSTAVQDSKALITIHNYYKSVEAIEQLYIRESDTKNWGEDLLERGIESDSEQNLTLTIHCNKDHDIKAVYTNNKDTSIEKVNLSCNEENKKLIFALYRSSIPEDNIDCSTVGQNKMLYDVMKDSYLWYEHTPDLDYESYTDLKQLLEDLKYKTYDRWSYITSAQSYQTYYEEGTYLGWGHNWKYFNDKIYITFVYKGSPADEAGLKRGAEVLEINGKTISEIENEGLWSTILGENKEGVELNLKVIIDTETKELTVKKSIVTISTVLEKKVLVSNGKKIGYLNFKSFIEPSRLELKNAFEYFKNERG